MRKTDKRKRTKQGQSDNYFEGNRISYVVELFAENLDYEKLYKMSEIEEIIKSDSIILKAIIYGVILPFPALSDRYYLNEYLVKDNITRERI